MVCYLHDYFNYVHLQLLILNTKRSGQDHSADIMAPEKLAKAIVKYSNSHQK